MNDYISFKKIYEDEHLLEIKVGVSSGESRFTNTFYESLNWIEDTKNELNGFYENKVSSYKIECGGWGHETGNGYLQIYFNYDSFGKIFISTLQQAENDKSSEGYYAEDCRLYLETEPKLLSQFLSKLSNLENKGEEIILECVDFPNKGNMYLKFIEPEGVNKS